MKKPISRYVYKNFLHSQFSINHVIDEWKEKITKTEWRVYIYPYVYSFCQTSKSQQKNQLSSSKTRKSLLSLEKIDEGQDNSLQHLEKREG